MIMLVSVAYIFLLFHISVIVYSNEDVPTCPSFAEGCTCSSEMYDCSNRQLHKMIEKTEESVRTLDLSHNSISDTVVLEAPSLTYLSLAFNNLNTLRFDTFDNLDELKTLVLSNNSLSRITDDIFEWNPLKLEILRLDGNQIEFIQHFLFYDLEQLTELDMSKNKITFIHPHAFAQMKKLTKLNLSGNHLHTFDSKWFKGLRANMFTEMDLSANRWSCDCTMKSQAQWLNSKKARWFLKVLSSKLVCVQPDEMNGREVKSIATEEHPQCLKPHITGISQSTTLYVNQSIELDCVVDKSRLPVASVMWIAPNHDHYSLQTADRFEGIEVHQNGKMVIHRVKLDDAGVYKCVASNNVSSVQATTTLTIKPRPKNGKNNLVKIGNHNITKHDYIHVDKNCSPKCKCFSQHVDCSSDTLSSKMTELDYSLLPNNTVSASFASNAITSVFAPKTKFTLLMELRLDDNSITDIAKHAFDNLNRLQTLTLRNNKLTTLHRKLFRRLTKLTILVLDNNELTAIDDDMFYGLSSLQWIYIRNNLIKSISSAAFAQLHKVKFIHMEGNKISTIFPETITALTAPKGHYPVNIKKIFVEENPFICNCEMNGLRIYLNSSDKWENLFGAGIRCSFPVEYNGQYLLELHGTLPCSGDSYKNVTTVGGPGAGEHCHFPFEYNGLMYSKCIAVHDNPMFGNNVWCSTAEHFDEQSWGVCPSEEYVGSETKTESSGAMSGLWFAGLLVALVLFVVGFVLWRKYGRKLRSKSVRYSDLPRDDMDEYQSLTSGNRGSEAYV